MTAGSAKIQATVNGQTVTIAEVSNADLSSVVAVLSGGGSIGFALSRPVKVDAGTAINLVFTSSGAISEACSACVHTISQSF